MNLNKLIAPILMAGLLGTGITPASAVEGNTEDVVYSANSSHSADSAEIPEKAANADNKAAATAEAQKQLSEKMLSAVSADEENAETSEEKAEADENKDEDKAEEEEEEKELTEEEKTLITPDEDGNVNGSSDEEKVEETNGNKYTPYLNDSGEYTGAVVSWDTVPENSKRRLLKASAEKMLGWGYSQPRRMEDGWRDCSSFVYTALSAAGLAPQTSWAWTTYTMPEYTDLLEQISWDEMQPGDIVLGDGHVAFYWGKDAAGNAMTLESCGGFGVTYGYLMCNGWNFPYTSVWRVKGIDEGTAWAQTAQSAQPAPQPQPAPAEQTPAPAESLAVAPLEIEVKEVPMLFRNIINTDVIPPSLQMAYQDWDVHAENDH